MLIYRVHGISRYSSCSTVLRFTYSIRFWYPSLSLSLSLSYSVKRRISSAVRNLQILFQLHPRKRSFSPVPAGKTACAILKTRPIVELRVSRANFHLDNSCERSTEEKKEERTEKMRDWERESKRELHRGFSLEVREVQESSWRGSLLCNYRVLHN